MIRQHDTARLVPKTGDEELAAGISRNFEVFEPLDFLAEVTQHIPNTAPNAITNFNAARHWNSLRSRTKGDN